MSQGHHHRIEQPELRWSPAIFWPDFSRVDHRAECHDVIPGKSYDIILSLGGGG